MSNFNDDLEKLFETLDNEDYYINDGQYGAISTWIKYKSDPLLSQLSVKDWFNENHIRENGVLVATYGTDDVYIDVSAIVLAKFVVNGKINIPADCNFNSFFGDPIYGHVKKLKLIINSVKYELIENESHAFTIDYSNNQI